MTKREPTLKAYKYVTRCLYAELVIIYPAVHGASTACTQKQGVTKLLTSAMAYGCGDSGSSGRFMNSDISGSATFLKGFNAIRIVPCKIQYKRKKHGILASVYFVQGQYFTIQRSVAFYKTIGN